MAARIVFLTAIGTDMVNRLGCISFFRSLMTITVLMIRVICFSDNTYEGNPSQPPSSHNRIELNFQLGHLHKAAVAFAQRVGRETDSDGAPESGDQQSNLNGDLVAFD